MNRKQLETQLYHILNTELRFNNSGEQKAKRLIESLTDDELNAVLKLMDVPDMVMIDWLYEPVTGLTAFEVEGQEKEEVKLIASVMDKIFNNIF